MFRKYNKIFMFLIVVFVLAVMPFSFAGDTIDDLNSTGMVSNDLNNNVSLIGSDDNYVATTGDDINGDESSSNPYATIEHGLLKANQTQNNIIISEGVYKESELAVNSNVYIVGDGNDVIDGQKLNAIFDITNLTVEFSEFKDNNNACASIEKSRFDFNNETIINTGKIVVDATDLYNNNSVNRGTIVSTDGIIDVKNLILGNNVIDYTSSIGVVTSSGNFSNVIYSNVKTGILSVYKNYWFIGDKGFETIYDALDAAVNGDVIEGLPGRYYITSTIVVPKNVTIMPRGDGEVIFDAINKKETVILQILYSTLNVTLKGLTFTNAFHEGDAGALYAKGNVYIYNCTFTNNEVTGLSDGQMVEYSKGGAVFAYNANVTIRDSTFINNTANYGGAIYVNKDSDKNAFLDVNNTKFIRNVGTTYHALGGAIYLFTADMLVNNSAFINNTAVESNPKLGEIHGGAAGAIYSRSNKYSTVTNCNFTGNQAHYWGGAIRSNIGMNVTNCNFVNNTVGHSGGALFGIFALIEGCVFENNSAVSKSRGLKSEGGAVCSGSKLTINNCKFYHNDADDGGALYAGSAFITLTNSIFENNVARYYGGVLSIHGNLVDINNNTFINNKAFKQGGAICIYGHESLNSVHILNSVFIGNVAVDGGALYIHGLKDVFTVPKVKYNEFINNTAENGDVLFIDGPINFNYNALVSKVLNDGSVVFVNNSDKGIAGKIDFGYNWWGNSNPKWDVILVGINATFDYAVLVSSLDLNKILFGEKTAIKNILYWNGTTGSDNISLIPLRHINLSTNGGILESNNGTMKDGKFSTDFKGISNGNFTIKIVVDNDVQYLKVTVGDIVLLPVVYVNETGSDEFGNGSSANPFKTIENAIKHVANGGTIILNGKFRGIGNVNITIDRDGLTFIGVNGSVIDGEGVNWLFDIKKGNAKFTNITLANGFKKGNGGAINIATKQTLTLNNVNLINNTAYNGGSGGAVYGGNIDIIGGIFNNNSASTNGGAIVAIGNVKVNGSKFINNKANKEGGAIYATTVDIDCATFAKNTVIGEGGAIYLANRKLTSRINNSVFEFNSISEASNNYGGVIVNKGTLIVDNSKFTNNSAYGGGAIDNSGVLNITSSCFENNKATGRDAGAISNTGTATVVNSKFVNNFALRDGGAIKNKGTFLTVIDSEFISNVANGSSKGSYGGAIYNWVASSKISNSVFINNSAYTRGGAIYVSGGNKGDIVNIGVYNSIFTDNSAEEGGAIFLENTRGNINYNAFVDNAVDTIHYGLSSRIDNNYNWWGNNTPNWGKLFDNAAFVPNTFAVLALSANKFNNNSYEFIANLYWNNTNVAANIPVRCIELLIASDIINGQMVNGVFKYNYTFDKVGKYTVTANVDHESQSIDLEVKGAFLTVPVLVKYYGSGDKLLAYLFDGDGNPIVNASVVFNVNGVNCTIQTNSCGIASMNINLIPGFYNVSVEYGDVLVKSNVTVKTTMFGSNLVKMYKTGTGFVVKVLDTSGKVLANQNVSFNINGVFYNRKTDENGIAKLNINLRPGEYINCYEFGYW